MSPLRAPSIHAFDASRNVCAVGARIAPCRTFGLLASCHSSAPARVSNVLRIFLQSVLEYTDASQGQLQRPPLQLSPCRCRSPVAAITRHPRLQLPSSVPPLSGSSEGTNLTRKATR